ncbi:light-harvesting antenna LH1, beta subunit [Telmatospirillum siberiense]|uniref:Light-harvesting protein n=1 Tax=Telmatospirillum siberiense TaxID=382514 RepID=A0A2N3PTC9_9PROT|nr:light-harvesting antenna LH1, beta subunit [Telmatospirillum siberiense]PKU23660.1 light-harvesting protein [Telmatospirillum siberiense]
MVSRDERSGTLSGLTETEAKEFHSIFVFSFVVFTLVAAVAHLLVWLWRPWIPGPNGYSAIESGVNTAQLLISSYFS